MASIFIQMASYHDFELGKTILHAIKQGSKKHEIHFGVFNCYYQNNDIYIPNVENLKIIEKEAPFGVGVGKSRNIANSLYDGQDYYLQVDSHTRFKENWDEFLISQIKGYQEIGIKKPLLTTYPGTYRYNDNLEEVIDWGDSVTAIYLGDDPEQFKDTFIPGQRAVSTEGSILSKSISAGSIFSIGEFADTDFNDKIAFWGEEIFVAAQSWTRGFDLIIPSIQQIFHLYYETDSRMQKSGGRRHVWKDFPELFKAMDIESKAEIKRIFKENIIGKNALGSVRTLKEFEVYSGLDFTNGTITENC
jgi:hypothetical protein